MLIHSAGQATQASTGFVVTRDESSIRHEQSHADQVREVIDQAYAPLEKRPPLSQDAWHAHLLAYAPQLHRDIDGMIDALQKVLQEDVATRRHRKAGSVLRRGAAELLSVPDKGNVKANTVKAIRLGELPGPKKLTKPAPFAVEPLRDGYQSMPELLKVLSVHQRHRKLLSLKQETQELLQALQQTEVKSKRMRADTSRIRAEMLDSVATGRATPEQELLGAVEHCEELEQALHALHRKISALEQAGLDSVPCQQEQERLRAKLQLSTTRRDVAMGLHAPQVLPAMMSKLHQLQMVVDKADAECREEKSAAIDDLQQSQQAEIAQSLAHLRDLGGYRDQPALRAFIDKALHACHSQPFDVEAHRIPAPLLTDIFIAALARVIGPESTLDAHLLEQTYKMICARPGGSLALEQIRGIKMSDARQRVAQRVEALADTTLARLAPAETPAASGAAEVSMAPRQLVLQQASQVAAQVLLDSRHSARGLPQACFSAVRNGFFAGLDNETGVDKNLIVANGWIEKMLSDWIAPAKEKKSLNLLKDKRPFSDDVLKMQAMTATLGYDVPARPMARLDKNMREALQRMRAMVPQASLDSIEAHACTKSATAGIGQASAALAPASLDGEQLLRLAAMIALANKNEAAANAVRPGHIKLEAGDAGALSRLIETQLHGLLREDAQPLTPGQIADFISAYGDTVAGPHSLVDFFDEIKAHMVSGSADGSLDPASEELHKNISMVRHMILTEEVRHISTREDLYVYLATKIYQFELRGKLKSTEGGTVGASSKIFTWPLSLDPGTISLVLPLRGELKAGAVRCAVFEIGFSTTAFEFFMGSETRSIKGAGAGAGARLGWEVLLSSGGGVDKTVTIERADTKGVWLRLPRAGNDEVTREQALAVLKTMLDTDGTPSAVPAPASDARVGQWLSSGEGVELMPRIIGDLLGQHENLSVSVVDTYHEDVSRNEAAPNAALLNVAGGTGDYASRIQVLNTGIKSERRKKTYHQSDATGFMQTTRSNEFAGGNSSWQGGVLSVNGLFAIGSGEHNSDNFGGIYSTQKQLAEAGVDTKLRFITRDGETNAVDTRIDWEDINFQHHLARVNRLQRELVTLGMEQLNKGLQEPPPLHAQELQARQWLYANLEQAHRQSRGNSRHVFSISYCLQALAAATIDGLAAKAELEQMQQRPRQSRHTANARDLVLQHPPSFKPWKVTTSERTSEAVQFGLNFGLTYAKLRKTEGQRGTNSYPA